MKFSSVRSTSAAPGRPSPRESLAVVNPPNWEYVARDKKSFLFNLARKPERLLLLLKLKLLKIVFKFY